MGSLDPPDSGHETGDSRPGRGGWFRRARDGDAARLLELIRELALFEELAPPDSAAADRLMTDIFGPAPRLEAYMGGFDKAAVAYALVLETYSSFLARPTLYLEDLYVQPEYRSRGLGEVMVRRLAAEAVSRGCGRMEWVVLDWNEGAQRFYRRTGAEMMDGWRICRLSGEALEDLALDPGRR